MQDVAFCACCLQRSHIFCTPVCRNHHPVIAAGGQHHIHQETAHSAIPVHIWVNISEEKVTKYSPDYRTRLICQQLEQHRHCNTHIVRTQRCVQRACKDSANFSPGVAISVFACVSYLVFSDARLLVFVAKIAKYYYFSNSIYQHYVPSD